MWLALVRCWTFRVPQDPHFFQPPRFIGVLPKANPNARFYEMDRYECVGERSHLLGPSVDLETHIRDVTSLLFYEDLSNVVLVGHSYAGMVITGVAAKVPERLKLEAIPISVENQDIRTADVFL